jgi:putative ABC transport system permease protein
MGGALGYVWDALVLETLASLRAHALRFVLAALGVGWGALMLTFLSAQSGAMASHFRHELEEIGPKLVIMGPGVILRDRVGERASREVELEAPDVARIETLGVVEHASPNVELPNQPVRRGRRTKLLHVMGWDHDAAEIRSVRAAEGRFLSARDVADAAPVAFLGPAAKQRLFGAAPALGETVQIGSDRFRVIGIGVEKKDQVMDTGNPDDLMVVIPYSTAQRRFTRSERVQEMILSATRRELGASAIAQARELTALHRGFDPRSDTALWSVDFWDTLKVLFGMLFAIQLFMAVAGTLTLLVGAVGVMNIMLVVVTERTREIGVRKALGARDRDVFLQFLCEAVVVALGAGVLGTAAGLVLLRASAGVFERAGIVVGARPDPLTTAVVAGALVAVAVIAGVLPALRASRVPPAEALRSY